MPKKIIKNLSLTGIVKWVGDNYKQKKNGKPFTSSDVQGYVRRGHLPKYLGEINIAPNANEYSAKSYNLILINNEVQQ